MRDFVGEFIDMKAVEEGAALNTLEAYRKDMELYEREIYPIQVTDVMPEDIEEYLTGLKEEGLLPKTISRKISTIREFYKFLQSEKIIAENPANKLRTPKIGKTLPEFLTAKEIKKLCAACSAEKKFSWKRMEVMIKLMYSTGLRVSELVSLPENAVNYDMRKILINGKGSKERIVPVTKEVAHDVLEYQKERDAYINNQKCKWLFPSSKSLSGHMTRDGFFKNLKKMAIKAGISPSKVHPHVLRHSFATQLVNNHADLRSIQKMLGHENVVTTEIYTHITTQKLADEVRMRHPLTYKKINVEDEKD